jgi:hypothetical protein
MRFAISLSEPDIASPLEMASAKTALTSKIRIRASSNSNRSISDRARGKRSAEKKWWRRRESKPASALANSSRRHLPKHSASQSGPNEIRAFDLASMRNPNRRTCQQRQSRETTVIEPRARVSGSDSKDRDRQNPSESREFLDLCLDVCEESLPRRLNGGGRSSRATGLSGNL